ncbi:hypothetical protein K2173_023438 [Erythroxylum novogranatense]|uniref:Uncharacterized protein n=1 Tax=Erythroxylum novogranatense TaxID=1862640 RepID=A0AAV8TYA1_9ROSI|nr:hypothetical protein K2173_023438 [Erythroxylum novogranatense]
MALNHQQYSVRDSRNVNEVGAMMAQTKSMESLESKVDSLEHRITSQLSSITTELKHPNVHRPSSSIESVAPSCESCGSVMHISMSVRKQALTVQPRPPKEDTNRLTHGMMALMKEERTSTKKSIQRHREPHPTDSAKNAARFSALEKRMEQWETKVENMSAYVTQLSNNLSDNQARAVDPFLQHGNKPKSLNAIELRSGKKVHFDILKKKNAIKKLRLKKRLKKGNNWESIIGFGAAINLADRSFRHPVGIIEDILVQVKGLVFPADFYVLDMTSEVVQDTSLILGRPFLRTASTMINMKEGKITMEVGDQHVSFNMYEAMKL